MQRYQGEEVIPKRLPCSADHLAIAAELIALFQAATGSTRAELQAQLHILEGEETDYRMGSVSKVEMATPIALICKVLFPSISTFETPPSRFPIGQARFILGDTGHSTACKVGCTRQAREGEASYSASI